MKPFIFQLDEGYLIGLACNKCISKRLTDRRITHEKIDKLPIAQDIFDSLISENNPGVMYEIAENGESIRMECYIERHPNCNCKSKTIRAQSKHLNFAFSSIFQIKSARFGTPQGNVWVSHAFSDTNQSIGIGDDKESSRLNAAFPDLKAKNIAEHIANRYRNTNKSPMLIVGANNWVRNMAPFFLLQQYDIHILFFPNALNTWVCGVLALSRTNAKAEPVWSYAANQTIETSLKLAIQGLIPLTHGVELKECNPKLNAWTTLWVYRCPKVALRDILALEPYSGEIEFDHKPEPVSKGIFRLIKGAKAA